MKPICSPKGSSNNRTAVGRNVLVLWLDWKIPSGNRTSGVKAKIAAWKAARRAFDSALASSPSDIGSLMHTITSVQARNHWLIGLLPGSDSKVTPTTDSPGSITKSAPPDPKA